MREVKFRVKGITGDKLWFFISMQEFARGGEIAWDMMDIKTISESTGLLDKNNKEIYEGDVVEFHRLGDRRRKKVCKKIVFSSEKEVGFFTMSFYESARPILKLRGNREYKIIGNIYEQPELLGKELTHGNRE